MMMTLLQLPLLRRRVVVTTLLVVVLCHVVILVTHYGMTTPTTSSVTVVTAFQSPSSITTRSTITRRKLMTTTTTKMTMEMSSPPRHHHHRRSMVTPQQRHHRLVGICIGRTTTFTTKTTTKTKTTSTSLNAASPSSSSREEEIRRKIRQLKKEGKIGKNTRSGGSSEAFTTADGGGSNNNNENDDDEYRNKIRNKLGKSKSRLLGFGDIANNEEEYNDVDDDDEEFDDDLLGLSDIGDVDIGETSSSSSSTSTTNSRMGRIGSMPELQQQRKNLEQQQQQSWGQSQQSQQIKFDPTLFDKSSTSLGTDEKPEMSEEELIELVAQRLAEKRAREDAAIAEASRLAREERQRMEEDEAARAAAAEASTSSTSEPLSSSPLPKQTTTGVGGTWIKDGNNVTTSPDEMYKPKSGSWGAFPRPKDISKAYGGGRRVGVGYSKEDDERTSASIRSTQELLREYRQKVGIDVPTEKEHATEIEEALKIGQLAMSRGVYATAVSALEKVTQWCSTNSKVGSKVYLELAMAYEAVGRTKEAYQVYKTLTECRMEDVKYNAKRLLYGMEAMEIMRDVSSDFSRKKTRNTFIDATGLDTFVQNFDDKYNTAYIDLDGGFYKKLTESVVRSNREARQILLKATGKGEVTRTKIIQALRCISRQFDESLQSEIAANVVEEPTAYLNGEPILKGTPTTTTTTTAAATASDSTGGNTVSDFTLLSAQEMLMNLNGRWQLQLLADKQGDGVSYYNTTSDVQEFVTSINNDEENSLMTFTASGRSGLVNVESSGRITMDLSQRVVSRSQVTTSGGGGILGVLPWGRNDYSGFSAAVSRDQQIMNVDSILLITRCPKGSRNKERGTDQDKEHFAVWRRIQ